MKEAIVHMFNMGPQLTLLLCALLAINIIIHYIITQLKDHTVLY